MTNREATAADLSNFRDDLIEETAQIRAHVAAMKFDLRMLLLTVVRSYDAEQFHYEIGVSPYPPELVTLLNFGMNATLAHLVPAVRGGRGIPFFAMNPKLREFAVTLLSHHGRVALAHRLLDLTASGLMTAYYDGEKIRFVRASGVVGIEALDRLEHDRLAAFRRRQEGLDDDDDEATENRVQAELRAQVRIWKEHFIAYKPTPFLDEVFQRRAFKSIVEATDFGSVQPEADFGDFTGAEFLSVAMILKDLHFKHIAFCIEYLRKFPNQRADNILSIWIVKSELVASISDRIGLSRSKVRRCLNMLSLGPRNAGHHLRRLTTSIPSLIEVGDDIWIRPLSSGLEMGSDFVCMELRRAYPKAWSRNINLREAMFRRDLYGLFADEKYLKLEGSKILKRDKRILTDVDATIFDSNSGTLALFQLKWQEVFGWDERERRSRADNFTRECRDWLVAVEAFSADRTPTEVAERLGVPGKLASQCRRIRPFIVGKFATRFSGFDLPSPDVAVATWTQLVAARGEQVTSPALGEDPIDQLHEMLRAERTISFEPTYAPFAFEVAGRQLSADELFFRAPNIAKPIGTEDPAPTAPDS